MKDSTQHRKEKIEELKRANKTADELIALLDGVIQLHENKRNSNRPATT